MPSEQIQFKPGNSGRPKGSRNKATRYRASLAEALTEEREFELWRALIAVAIDGDVPAARLVMEYRYGKPRQVPEIGTDFGLQSVQFVVMPVGDDRKGP